MAEYCPGCGAQLEDGQRFCKECGASASADYKPDETSDGYIPKALGKKKRDCRWTPLAALLCGVASVICCCCFVPVALIAGILAIIFGIIGIKQIPADRTKAIAGLLCGVLGALVSIIIIIAAAILGAGGVLLGGSLLVLLAFRLENIPWGEILEIIRNGLFG